MVEDKDQHKEPVNQAPKEEVSSKEEGTPEKKSGGLFSGMFRLFKKPKAKDDQSVGDPKSAPEAGKSAVVKPTVLKVQKINLKIINQILVMVLIGLVVMFLFVVLQERPEVSSVVAAISKIKLPEVESKPVVAFEKLSHYLDQIKKRDIFSIFQEKKDPVKIAEVVKAPEPPPIPVVPIEQKAKNIKLIGISWGENPKAMIRNINTQNVQFVTVGGKIDDTDLEVIKILKNEVILSSEGQEMSLM